MSKTKHTFVIVPYYKEECFFVMKSKEEKEYGFPEIDKDIKEFKKYDKNLKRELANDIQNIFGICSTYYNKDEFYNLCSITKTHVKNRHIVFVNFNSFNGITSAIDMHPYCDSIKGITNICAKEIMQERKNVKIMSKTKNGCFENILNCVSFCLMIFIILLSFFLKQKFISVFVVLYSLINLIEYLVISKINEYSKCFIQRNISKNKVFLQVSTFFISLFFTSCYFCFLDKCVHIDKLNINLDLIGLLLILLDILLKQKRENDIYF